MVRKLLCSVATLLMITGFAGSVQAETPGVRDAAAMFSADARNQADAELDRIRESTGWVVVIETVATHGKKSVDSLALENARALRIRGVYVLLAQREHKISIQSHKAAAEVFNASVREALKEKITSAFKEKRFDQGLLDGVAYAAQVASEKPAATVQSPAARHGAHEPAAGEGRRGSFLMTALIIGGAILLVFFIVRLFSGAGRPGIGGAPGGGFLSSLFGALGGVFLGNWLYNTFWGGHAHASDTGHSTSDTSGNDDYESTSGDWGSGMDGGGDGGGFDGGGFDGGGGDW
jgi:uncharacterized membrane protein YgcG